MKKLLYGVVSVILLFLGASCAKDNNIIRGTANINVINAAIGAGSVRVNPGAGSGFFWSKATDVAYSANAMFGAFTGTNTITVVSSTDTTKTLFQRTVNLQSISTLYIAGQSPAIDTVFRTETNIPYLASAAVNPDNSTYIRFVNLSPNSAPVNINIKSATTNEVTSLAYKGVSAFKKYDAQTTTANYIFEVRDAATNTLLFTYTHNTSANRYKTISLVIKGLSGTTTGTSAFGVFQVNYI